MRRFSRKDLEIFLKAVDRHAPKDSKLVIIGGAAAALTYGSPSGTVDIDTANNVSPLQKAYEAARRETNLQVPLALATVFDAPIQYKTRLTKLPLKGLRHLEVLVPEKHDWALSKISRLEAKDLEHLKAAFKTVKFDLATLENRFRSEMFHLEPRDRVMINFLAVLAELFGEREAARFQPILRGDPNWR
jgi:hypothetical protein